MTTGLLRVGLLAGVAYFLAMAAAHFTSFKVPILFIYYDTPFYSYQDKIISFCAVVYAILFYTAAEHIQAVPGALAAMAVTVAGLSAVNVSDDLARVLNGGSTQVYWIETGLIAVYGLALTALYLTQTPAKQSTKKH